MSDCEKEKGLTSCEFKKDNDNTDRCSWVPNETFQIGSHVIWFDIKEGNFVQKQGEIFTKI